MLKATTKTKFLACITEVIDQPMQSKPTTIIRLTLNTGHKVFIPLHDMHEYHLRKWFDYIGLPIPPKAQTATEQLQTILSMCTLLSRMRFMLEFESRLTFGSDKHQIFNDIRLSYPTEERKPQ